MSITQIKPDSGSIDGSPLPTNKNYDVQVINGIAQRIHNVVVHRFRVSAVDDPDLFAAEPLIDWEKSEQGLWVKAHAVEVPIWRRQIDHTTFEYSYIVTARLLGRDYTYWTLKWSTR